ncbi:DUF1015 domain-containing protein [Coriobacterium glomerans]|nr:DUF1015 domain-containing protein [Coriobacterium glomerans]
MNVFPFACVRPVPDRAAQVAALPYDVFDRASARDFVADRPLSFLNIDRPETQFPLDEDMFAPAVYARAATLFASRIEEGVLIRDRRRCFYIYELQQGAHTQRGIVGACALSDYEGGVIRRHEATRVAKRDDRVRHIRALGAQTGPALLAYHDETVLDAIIDAATAAGPLYRFEDEQGTRQAVWRIDRPEAIEAVRAMFERVPRAYIADGHHRLAAAARVGGALRKAAAASGGLTGTEPFNFILSVLVPASQLKILPYNRIVSDLGDMDATELLESVRAAGFEVESAEEPVEPRAAGIMGMTLRGRWWRLTATERLASEIGRADAVGALDVSVLQERILGPLLGIDDPRRDGRIRFAGGEAGCAAALERLTGRDGVAFSVHATAIEQLFAVADAGLLMPPKSTWFEPKLRSGLFAYEIR